MNTKRSKKAFTLVELVITIALFALVAGMVVAFISFMTNFNRNNAEINNRARQLSYARREIDFWFSYFDSKSSEGSLYDFSVVSSSGDESVSEGKITKTTVVCSATSVSKTMYTVKFVKTTDVEGKTIEANLVFAYPEASNRGVAENGICSVTVEATTLSEVNFVEYDSSSNFTPESDSDNYFRFVVNLPVNGKMYACNILY